MNTPILSPGHPLANIEETIRRDLSEGYATPTETLTAFRVLLDDAAHRGITYVQRLQDGTERPIHQDGITSKEWIELSAILDKLKARIQIAAALRYLIRIGLVIVEPGDTLHEQFL